MLAKRFYAGNIRPEILARLAAPVNILLIILLAHSLASLSWSLITSTPSALPSFNGSMGQIGTTPSPKGIDYAAIADWHLFGVANRTVPVVKAPETKLNLRLVGIFHAENGGKTLAIIAEANGEERIYTVGDQMAAGIRLEQAHRRQIVLSRNGRLETLSLPRDSGIADAVQPRQRPIGQTGVVADAEKVDVSDIAKRVRNAIKIQPEAIQDLALARPYIQNGRFKGFRLHPGRKQELLGQLGLKNDDVIVAVDGTPLDSPAQAIALLEEALKSNQFQALVLRNGAEIPFVFSLGDQ